MVGKLGLFRFPVIFPGCLSFIASFFMFPLEKWTLLPVPEPCTGIKSFLCTTRKIILWKQQGRTCKLMKTPLSCDMTKTTKWLCAQRKLRSAWASAQSDQSHRCLHEESLCPYLPTEHTAKTLIRLGRCPGWSESSLGAHSFCWFCHVAFQLLFLIKGFRKIIICYKRAGYDMNVMPQTACLVVQDQDSLLVECRNDNHSPGPEMP